MEEVVGVSVFFFVVVVVFVLVLLWFVGGLLFVFCCPPLRAIVVCGPSIFFEVCISRVIATPCGMEITVDTGFRWWRRRRGWWRHSISLFGLITLLAQKQNLVTFTTEF